MDIGSVNAIDITASDSTGAAFASVEQGLQSLGSLAGNLASQFGSLGGIIGAAFGALGVGAFGVAISSAIDFQAQLGALAARSGATVESLSAMRAAADYAGIGMDQVAQTMQRFATNIIAAQTGTGKQAAALTALGFDAKTFASQYTTTDQAIVAVAQALNQYGDSMGKAAIEQTLLGRGGGELAAFLQQLAVTGTANVQVTKEQQVAAKALEDSITSLRIQGEALLNSFVSAAVPVLQKVVDGLGTFKNIAIAAIGALVVWPAAINLVAAALAAYREATLAAAAATFTLGTSVSAFDVWAAGSLALPVQFTTGWANALKAVGVLFLTFFAAYSIAKWADDNFAEVRIAGDYLVQTLLLGWQNLEFHAKVVWAAIVLAFQEAADTMRGYWATAIGWIASGLSALGATGMADSLRSLAASVTGGQSAMTTFKASVAAAGAELDAGKAKVYAYSNDLLNYEYTANAAGKAIDALNKNTVNNKGVTQPIKDATAALDAYIKSLEGLATAQSDALAKGQLQAITSGEADIKRQYDQGVLDFQQYWDALTALQKTAIDVQEQEIQNQIAHQQVDVAALEAAWENLDPSRFKNWGDFLAQNYKSEQNINDATAKLTTLQGNLNVVVQKGADIGKDYVSAYLVPASDGLLKLIPALDQEIAKQQTQNEQIGLTATQIAALNIQRVEEARQMTLMAGPPAAGVLEFYDQELDRLHKLMDVTGQGEQITQLTNGWKSLFTSAADEGATFIENFVQHGSSAFKTLWGDFLTWALDSFAKIAAQQIVINIAGAIGLGGAATNAFAGSSPLGTLLSGGSAASSLLSGGSSGGLLNGLNTIGGLTSALGLPTVTTALGNVGGAFSTFSTLLDSGTGIVDAASAATVGLGASLATMAAAAIPIVGIVIAAAAAFGLFGSKGGPKVGGYASNIPGVGFYPGETGAAGNASSATLLASTQSTYAATLAALGGTGSAQFALGFDTDPQGTAGNRVSGAATVNGQQVIKQLDVGAGTDSAGLQAGMSLEAQRVILAALQASSLPTYLTHLLDTVSASAGSSAEITALLTTAQTVKTVADAFDKLLNPAQVTAFTTALNGINFATTSDALKAVAEAAFGQLDPALVSVVDKFQGTDAQLQTFVTTLAGIAAGTTGLSAAFKANVDAALADATQATADDVAALVQIVNTLGVALPAVSADLETLSGTNIPGFIEALGGASAALSTFTYLQTNFLTTAQQTAAATATLKGDFAALGLAVPATHAAFLDLLNGINLTTASGQQLYASIAALAPLFVQVYGTAQQAAAALSTASTALSAVATAAGTVVSVGSLINAGMAEAKAQLASFATIANESPGDFGQQLGIQLGLIQDAIKAASPSQFTSGVAFTAYTDALQASNASMTDELARFTVLSAQYGATQAKSLVDLEDWYTQQQQALSGNSDALTALTTVYNQKWASIIAGTATGTTAVTSSLDSIVKYLQGLFTGTLSPLTPMQQLATAKNAYQTDLTAAQGGDATAISNLTTVADAYLKLEQSAYASSPTYVAAFNQVTSDLGKIAGTQPNGQPLATTTPASATAAIAAALPTGTKLASSADITAQTNALVATLVDVTAAHANAATANTRQVVSAVKKHHHAAPVVR